MYAASSTYYGNQAVPFSETDPFRPTSPYAASKYMGELVMLTNDNLYKLLTCTHSGRAECSPFSNNCGRVNWWSFGRLTA